MFLWLNFILSCVLSFGFRPTIYNDFTNTNLSTETSNSLNCSETKVRDNYVYTNDYLFLMFDDMRSNQFGDGLFSNTITNLGTQFNNFPHSISYPTNEGDYIEATIGDAVNGSTFGYFRQLDSNYKLITLNGYPVTQITFRKTFGAQFSNGSRLYLYDVIFYSRQGNGESVALIGFSYTFSFPLKYSTIISTYVDLGNYCVTCGANYFTGSPITSSNASRYVYQEYLGEDYPHPLYSSYYLSIDSSVDVETARQQGYSEGWTNGRNTGYSEGRQTGYAEGIAYAQSQDTTALTIFTGIVDIGLLPVNVFLKIFEFEVFGINVAGALSALLTIAITFIILRFVTGKKND